MERTQKDVKKYEKLAPEGDEVLKRIQEARQDSVDIIKKTKNKMCFLLSKVKN